MDPDICTIYIYIYRPRHLRGKVPYRQHHLRPRQAVRHATAVAAAGPLLPATCAFLSGLSLSLSARIILSQCVFLAGWRLVLLARRVGDLTRVALLECIPLSGIHRLLNVRHVD
jgi:hypothetical protein